MRRSLSLARIAVPALALVAVLAGVQQSASVAQPGLSYHVSLPLVWNSVARDDLPLPLPVAATPTTPAATAPATSPATGSPTAEPSATLSPTATDTPVPTPTTPAAGSISGRLLVKGEPAVPGLGFGPGPALYLRKCSGGGAECANVDRSGVYDTAGSYKFVGPQPLEPGEFYQVMWVNEDNPPETLGDRQYLATWYGPRIAEHQAGDETSGGEFELADLQLLAPSNGTSFGFSGTPDLTFRWERRNHEVGGFSYRWGICSAESGCCQSVLARQSAWLTEPLGQKNQWVMTAYPPNVKVGTSAHPFLYPYCWFIRIQSAEAFTYGGSFFIRKIWFYNALVALAELGLIDPADWSTAADAPPYQSWWADRW